MFVDGFKPPLTAEQLREIGLRRDGADIIVLLWEIKRLRAHVLRADQVVQQIRNGDYLVETFRRELEGEPCIMESGRLSASADVVDMPLKGGRHKPDR